DTSVTKVFHAARQDVEIVWHLARVIPAPLFDTQLAAMVCGFGESISYVNVVRHVTDVALDKGARFTDWSKRPLSAKQLTYALADVTHLRDVYQYLDDELASAGRRHWLDEEMATLSDPGTYETQPQDAWQRLKARVKNRRAMAVLMELAAWREASAQSQNRPRSRILKDDALYDIANQQPESSAALGQLRSVPDGFERSARGRDLLEAVAAGLARDLDDVPSPKSGRSLSAQDMATAELLKVLLKACAAEHRVAPKMIADASDIERLATGDDDVAALTGWRHDIFGGLAVKLRRGELALALSSDGVIVREISP
ncbi:MAG: HRDC domain-containing protein, partial [Pseudomonadota bacterium]